MRGRVHARRTLKGLVADLRFNVDKSYHISAKIGDAIQMTIKICLDKPDNTDSFLSHLTNWNRNNNVQADENNK